jgi:hypothetical protein
MEPLIYLIIFQHHHVILDAILMILFRLIESKSGQRVMFELQKHPNISLVMIKRINVRKKLQEKTSFGEIIDLMSLAQQ